MRKSRRTYGSPRVHAELAAEGVRCGRKRVECLMREDGLAARLRRRFRSTTDSAHSHPIAPNLLERHFGTEDVGAIDTVWACDITYVPTREGWLYLAAVLDLASRRVVGWSMRDTLKAELATHALQMALVRRRPEPGLVHHSDRGVRYACRAYRELLDAHGVRARMSKKGDCWDDRRSDVASHGVTESFFATLEWELIEGSDGHTHPEARRGLFDYIEVWYYQQRRHSTLGYLSPAEYEDRLALKTRAA